MKEETISRIAVIILAIVLGAFGIYHFIHPSDMLLFVPNFLPGTREAWRFGVYIVGAVIILLAIALLMHKYVKIAGYCLAILLFVFVLLIHIPNYSSAGDTASKTTALIDILQDLALAAFAMYIASNSKKI
jgi:putative oxidoreductase